MPSLRTLARAMLCLTVAFAVQGAAPRAVAQTEDERSPAKAETCQDHAPAAREWIGRKVGVTGCRILAQRFVFDARGRRVVRLDIALDGTVGGWAALRRQPHFTNFTDAPDIVLAQLRVTGPQAKGIARYEGDKGAGLTLFVPLERGAWNGKLFVTAHGADSYAQVGRLVPRDGADKFHPDANVNKFVGLMIDKGYAVAHTRRSAAIPIDKGDTAVTLEDGRRLAGYQLGQHAGLIVDWTALAKALIRARLGEAPKRTYLYGFSSGAMVGRLLNYRPEFNDDGTGGRVFDGILADDAGGGLWLPVLERDGRDVLFGDEASRALFVPQIDLTHLLYDTPRGLPRIANKRRNAKLLVDKGLGDKHRLYEIEGVSHFDAGYGPEDLGRGRDLKFQNIDLTPVMSAMIDRLDAWVDKGTAPPATRSNDPALAGGRGEDGALKNPAIALPQVACPLGVYHAYPAALGKRRIGVQVTGFAAFDGANLEPLDGLGRLVDMNGNGKRDRRETVTEAWRRLGLLKKTDGFTRLVYTSCVNQAAERLARAGLISKEAELHFKQEAPESVPPGLR